MEGLPCTAEFEIKLRVAGGSIAHAGDRLAGQHPLPNHGVDPVKTGQSRMISPAVVYDQDKAIAPKGSGVGDFPVTRRHPLLARACAVRNSLVGADRKSVV